MKVWSHPKRVQLGILCHTEEEVARAYETLSRIAAGFAIDSLETTLSGETMWCTDPACDCEVQIRAASEGEH